MQIGITSGLGTAMRAARIKANTVPPAPSQDGGAMADMQPETGSQRPQHLMRVVIEAQMVQAGLRNANFDPKSAFATQYALANAVASSDPLRTGRASSLTLRV